MAYLHDHDGNQRIMRHASIVNSDTNQLTPILITTPLFTFGVKKAITVATNKVSEVFGKILIKI